MSEQIELVQNSDGKVQGLYEKHKDGKMVKQVNINKTNYKKLLNDIQTTKQ